MAACLAKQSNCKIMVMHVKESDAKSLALQTDYETLALKERVEIQFFARPRRGDSVHEAVVELAEELQVDFLYPEKNKASANPVRGTFPDGVNPVIKPGDELILPPFGS